MKIDDLKQPSYATDDTEISNAEIDRIKGFMEVGDIDGAASIVATFIVSKMYGKQVRKSLALWVFVTQSVVDLIRRDEENFKNAINRDIADFKQLARDFGYRIKARMDDLETRQTDVENQFKNNVGKLTKDNEVVLARNSRRFGNYPVLDDRLEFMESLLSKYVPAGFTVKIPHNQNRNPTVKVMYYEFALGTEPCGLGTGPSHSFGGMNYKDVPNEVKYLDNNNVLISLPLEYASNNSAIYKHGCWYLINDHKTLKFDLGEIKDSSLPGNGISSTEKPDIPNVPDNPDKPVSQFIVTIQHNQGRNPTVKAKYYEYAIGTEPKGLGAGPANSFGGINYQDLPIQVAYPDSNKVLIALPLKYASNNQIIFQNGKWYLIAGYQTICFDLGTIDSSKVPANSSSGSTSGGDSGQDNTNNQVLTPTGLRAGRISDQWAELVWQQGE